MTAPLKLADACERLHMFMFGGSDEPMRRSQFDLLVVYLQDRLMDWHHSKGDWQSAYDHAYRALVEATVHNAQTLARNHDYGKPEATAWKLTFEPELHPTIGQRADGTWYWLDETWNVGDDVHHETHEAAIVAQKRYCEEVL